MVKITVVQCTKRQKPHFEWSLESLGRQTFKDFEFIIVDGIDNRKDDILEIVKNANADFSVLYLNDKPSRWKGKRPALCNSRNTALIFANGEYIVHCDDCCRMPDDWLAKHLAWLEKGYIVAGVWISYQNIDDSGKGIVGPFGWEYRTTILKETREMTAAWFYGGNFSFPVKVAEQINGFDELYDGEMGQDDIDFGLRAERVGYKMIYDPNCYVEYFYFDHGLLMTVNVSIVEEDPNSNYWKNHNVEINVTPVNRVLKDGKEHFSNEFLMQELLDDPERYWTRGNVVNIKGTRDIVKSGMYSIEQMYKMMENWIDFNPRDWRDGILISEKIGNWYG